MIVVSDTSPLNYLVLIEFPHILPALFERVLIPEAVDRELRSAIAPDSLKRFLASKPGWLETRSVTGIDQNLRQLDPGERDVIALALATSADLVLLDERRGRQVARERGLAVSGTLGVVDLAARRGLLDRAQALDRLERTTFRVSPRLLRLVREARSGRQSPERPD